MSNKANRMDDEDEGMPNTAFAFLQELNAQTLQDLKAEAEKQRNHGKPAIAKDPERPRPIKFLYGPWDRHETILPESPYPERFPVVMSTQVLQIPNPLPWCPSAAFPFFVDVAVYELQCSPEGAEFYRFMGYSEMMAGI